MSRHSFHLLGQHLTSLNMEVSGLSFQTQKADIYMTDKDAEVAQMEAQLEEAQLREGQLRQALAQAQQQQQQAPAQSQQQQQQLLEDKQRQLDAMAQRCEQVTQRCTEMTQRYHVLQGVLRAMTAAGDSGRNGQPLPIFMRLHLLHLLASKYSMCTSDSCHPLPCFVA